jgi:hypothetical protein
LLSRNKVLLSRDEMRLWDMDELRLICAEQLEREDREFVHAQGRVHGAIIFKRSTYSLTIMDATRCVRIAIRCSVATRPAFALNSAVRNRAQGAFV